MRSPSAKSFAVAALRRIKLLAPLCRLRTRIRHIPEKMLLARRVWRVKRNYARVLKRIRTKPKGEKVRVLFLVGEPAKWKCQKLYETMRDSGVFEPLVGLTDWNMQREERCPDDALDAFHKDAEAFFDRLGVKHVRTYSLHPRKTIDLAAYSPDIVFYSEPWSPKPSQMPEPVSRFALTCFIPYFVPSHGNVFHEGKQPLHRFLYAYITLNEMWADLFREAYSRWDHTTRFWGLGHPALDYIRQRPAQTEGEGTILYAPHFSFPFKELEARYVFMFGTFDWNGEEILAYAQAHPEFRWVFKPHPLMRRYLVESGNWTKEKTDAYYAAWEKLGPACYDGDYQGLFLGSRAMVTDCCSFLTEYAATGNPIIHLRRRDTGVEPLPPSRALFDSFYDAFDLCEMRKLFRTILEEGEDPKRERRLAAVRAAQIGDANASANIVKCLRNLLRR